MKMDEQESCDYRFSSSFIDFIDFSSFISISAKIKMDKRFALFTIKERNSKKSFNCWSPS